MEVHTVKAGRRDRVCAVVITYRPKFSELEELIEAVEEQVDATLLVDNSGDGKVAQWMKRTNQSQQVHVVSLPENRGVGTAQNTGIRWALCGGFSHVLFLDQDSVPQAGMTAKLLSALNELINRKVAVAAVGPQVVEQVGGAADRPFVSFQKLWIRRRYCNPTKAAYVPADFLISSGTLVPLVVFERVGQMDEGLFIDNVDLDWCFRARSLGLELYGVCGAVMKHRLGKHMVRVWVGRWFNVYQHEPIRQYYMMRNRVLLYRRSWSPTAWIIQDGLRAIAKFLLFGLVFSPRIRNIEMMLHGIVDGLAGKTGRFGGREPS